MKASKREEKKKDGRKRIVSDVIGLDWRILVLHSGTQSSNTPKLQLTPPQFKHSSITLRRSPTLSDSTLATDSLTSSSLTHPAGGEPLDLPDGREVASQAEGRHQQRRPQRHAPVPRRRPRRRLSHRLRRQETHCQARLAFTLDVR